MVTYGDRKVKTKLTLSVDKQLLEEYKNYCKQEGIIISRQVEKFMLEKIRKAR